MSRIALRVLVAIETSRFVLFGGSDDWRDASQPGRSALRARLASARAFTKAINVHANATTATSLAAL